MSINATLFGQMITFGLFVWFTMRFIWPLLRSMLDARALKISEGLAAAELGQKKLTDADHDAKQILKVAQEKAEYIVELAQKQADELIEAAKTTATQEKQRIVSSGQQEVEHAYQKAHQGLQSELANLVTVTAEKFLNRALTEEDQATLASKLVKS